VAIAQPITLMLPTVASVAQVPVKGGGLTTRRVEVRHRVASPITNGSCGLACTT
jgi:hypothetical protein